MYSAISDRHHIHVMCRGTEKPEEPDDAEIAVKTFRSTTNEKI